MNFRKKIRKYRRVIYLVVFILVLVVGLSARSMYRNTHVNTIKVVVSDSAKLGFVGKNEIISFLTKKHKEQIVGAKFKEINLLDLQNIVKQNPYVDSVTVFRSDENIVITLWQRKPVLHVYDSKNKDFYIDEKGYIFPASRRFTAYVPVATGNILSVQVSDTVINTADSAVSSILKDLYKLAVKIKNDDFASSLVTEIQVDKDTDFLLIPRIGRFKILFGDVTETKKKLMNLRAFYKDALPAVGWDKFSLVNLKYTNQIICKKQK